MISGVSTSKRFFVSSVMHWLNTRSRGTLKYGLSNSSIPIYRAKADGADGYSVFTVDVPPTVEPLTPYVFDLTGGYVASGIWTLGGDTVNYSDVYEVQAGTPYLLMLGGIVGSRFRSMFSEEDTSVTKKNITGKAISNVSNPAAYSYAVYKPTTDGFVTATKDNAGTAGLKTYLFRIPDLPDEYRNPMSRCGGSLFLHKEENHL